MINLINSIIRVLIRIIILTIICKDESVKLTLYLMVAKQT